MRHDESFDLPFTLPSPLPLRLEDTLEGRNHCDFVLLTPPLIGPEPRFDSPQPLVPQPVGHIREKTHHLKSKPELDSAQEKHLQHKVRIKDTTSLQTSPSRQVQELTGPAHHTIRWLQQDRKTKSPPTQMHQDRYAVCSLLSIPFSVGFWKVNCAALSKTLASSVSFTEVLVVPSTAQLCHDCCVLGVVSSSSQDHLSLFSRETCILEKSISPNFQLKESLTSLFLSPRCLYKRVFVFDHFVFSLRADRVVDRGGSMVVTSYSRFLTSGVSDTSESLGHFAESSLLSHNIVSDDFSWSSSNLIIRLYFLVGVRHRHRCERAFSQNTKETLNSSCIFKSLEVCTFEPLLSQVPADWPTNEPLHVPVHQVQASSKPHRCRFIVSKSQNAPFQTGTPLICRRPYCDSVRGRDSSATRLRYHVRHEYEYCHVCVNRSDDNMLDVCFQESQLTSDPTTTPQQCNKGDRQRCQSS